MARRGMRFRQIEVLDRFRPFFIFQRSFILEVLRFKFRLGVSASLSVSPFFIISFPSHWQVILVVVYALIFIGLFHFGPIIKIHTYFFLRLSGRAFPQITHGVFLRVLRAIYACFY